ncbi:hypothetical protein [Sphingomonas sp. R1]|uniref:hypothetical protein n=1 Tax=Sphingomonas sp. R1 TaxID=399176 RepID=UPI0022249B5F|nr:hypothetical protein [Sphingomonas sp. R1]UYY77778.1 hypothetical protein OIM94_01865 [Sphingomonas sp. R1]
MAVGTLPTSSLGAQRAGDALGYFPTPPWATRALCEWLDAELDEPMAVQTAWEPACGEMHMVRPLRERFAEVIASDVQPYGDHQLIDFPSFGWAYPKADWVITNPPFFLAESFIATAFDAAKRGVAMLVRTAFLESEGRVNGLFTANPPSYVLQFAERVVMLKGRLIRANAVDPFAEVEGRKASSATSYCWIVWLRGADGLWPGDTRLRWIKPCRARLERDSDYPDYCVLPAGPAPT